MQATTPSGGSSSVTYAQCSAALAAAAGATTTIAGPVTIQKNAIGTTRTTGLKLENTSTSGTQDAPDIEFIAHVGATVKRFRIGVKPSAGGISLYIDRDDGTGSYTEGNSIGYHVLDPNTFDERLRVSNGFMAAGVGGYGFPDSSGLSRQGGGDILLSHLATSLPMVLRSARSTGNTGAAFQFWANAGSLNAGYFLEVGDGTSFTRHWAIAYNGRQEWAQAATVAALGQLGMDTTTGRPLVWCSSSGATAASQSVAVQADVKFTHQAISGDVTLTGVGIFGEVDTAAARAITLPPIPSGVSDRAVDLWIVDATGTASGNNITLSTSASNTIRGASSFAINTDWGGVGLKHNGQTGASGKWFVVAQP